MAAKFWATLIVWDRLDRRVSRLFVQSRNGRGIQAGCELIILKPIVSNRKRKEMWQMKTPLTCAIPLLLAAAPLSAQQWIEVSPETAATHLVTKVEPLYPAFAKAAGVQGTVRLHIGIGLTGRIGALMETSGPPSLYQAAQDAMLQYVYKPFFKGFERAECSSSLG